MTVEDERDHAGLAGRGADQTKARDVAQPPIRVFEQRVFVCGNGRQAHGGHVVERCRQPRDVRDVAGAGLEPCRRLLILGPFERHVTNHVAAALPRRRLAQHVFATVQHADAGGAEHLVSGKDIPVSAERLHVHGLVGHGLRAVNEDARADGLGHRRHGLDRRDGAERIGDMRDRDDLRLRPEQLRVFVDQNLSVIVHRNDAQPGAAFRGNLLPGHDVRVMLQPADDDLVTGREMRTPPALRHQVDGLGRAAHEDDFVGRSRAQKSPCGFAAVFVRVSGSRRKRVRRPMDVRVLVPVERREPIDHRLRLLRRRGVVEPDERTAVDPFGQDRKIATIPERVERRAGRRTSRHIGGTSRVLARERFEVERRRRKRRRRQLRRRRHLDDLPEAEQLLGSGQIDRHGLARPERHVGDQRIGRHDRRIDTRVGSIGLGRRRGVRPAWRCGEPLVRQPLERRVVRPARRQHGRSTGTAWGGHGRSPSTRRRARPTRRVSARRVSSTATPDTTQSPSC